MNIPTAAYNDNENELEHNPKLRKVKCERCQYELITDLPGPKCRLCKRYMITVVNGLMAESTSQPT